MAYDFLVAGPQKIAYLAEENFREPGIRDKVSVKFISGMGIIFTSPHNASTPIKHCEDNGIGTTFKYNLTGIRMALRP